ncbi:hypothetical protein FACS189475_05290 [Betaproteobacteria bacterium]|nr:hypothetical protein FACS189475_05290 [Betaproteobacteria bacterium]
MRQNGWGFNRLLNHLKNTNEKIDFLEAYDSVPDKKLFGIENKSGIAYGVYETINKKGIFVELCLNFNNCIMNKENILNIINEYSKIIDIDYGTTVRLN